jgi:Lon protease-like protein
MYELPLFPLNTVLFPGMPLHLHIFEDRYKKMVTYCRKTGNAFGVVLIQSGVEANGPLAEPYQIGCTAHITHIQPLKQGRLNLAAIGLERFKVLTLKQHQPYLVGVVERFPLQMDDPAELNRGQEKLRPWLKRYIQMISQAQKAEYDFNQFPSEPISVAHLAAMLPRYPLSRSKFYWRQRRWTLMDKLQTIYKEK